MIQYLGLERFRSQEQASDLFTYYLTKTLCIDIKNLPKLNKYLSGLLVLSLELSQVIDLLGFYPK